ncbi:hypothetical protein [Halobacillus karajensis]|uniref:hypothetical protein n=1 Tax=Halobacillus karajensis TaxID=195088 RepID=UPI00045C8D76|nr:hypothetical protein [Halobacillus karajensis]CDQ21677.1 hypothetical protein BN982_04086 [Halobacillus karajensis]
MANIFQEIAPYNEFRALSPDEQKKALIEYRKLHTNKDIMKAWGLSQYEFHTKLLKNEFGLVGNKKRVTKRKAEEPKKETPKPVPEKVVVQEPEIEEGIEYKFKGTFSSGKLQQRLEKLSLITDEEGAEYEVFIQIKEKVNQ